MEKVAKQLELNAWREALSKYNRENADQLSLIAFATDQVKKLKATMEEQADRILVLQISNDNLRMANDAIGKRLVQEIELRILGEER